MEDESIAMDRQGYPVDLKRPIVVDDEGVHTELSITTQMGDKWVNFPTVWNGKRLNPDDPKQYEEIVRQVEAAKAAGWRFPEFADPKAAEAAAQDRSSFIGKLRAAEIQDAEKRMWEQEAAKRKAN